LQMGINTRPFLIANGRLTWRGAMMAACCYGCFCPCIAFAAYLGVQSSLAPPGLLSEATGVVILWLCCAGTSWVFPFPGVGCLGGGIAGVTVLLVYLIRDEATTITTLTLVGFGQRLWWLIGFAGPSVVLPAGVFSAASAWARRRVKPLQLYWPRCKVGCETCGYPATGLAIDVCPECGHNLRRDVPKSS